MRALSLQFLLVSGMLACTGGASDDRVDGSVADARVDAADPSGPDGGDPVLDGAPGPDGTLDVDAAAIPPDASPPTCGMAPTGNWQGTSRINHNGSGGGSYIEANVVWMLESTTECIDTFRPTGTVRYGYAHSGGSEEHTAAVNPGDGMLVIDRTNPIATYTIVGATAAAGGSWADQGGSFDGRAFGGYLPEAGGSIAYHWSIVRVDAVFPATGCSEPVTETWHSATALADTHGDAEATWTRTSTVGCVDEFSPSGTAHTGSHGTAFDATLTYNPDHGPIDPNQPDLIIDRSKRPPTFEIRYGSTSWPAQLIYTYPDGRVETSDGWGISIWAEAFQGPYDGNHFSAHLDNGTGWTFSR
jgi:hypothetical protein